MDLRPLINRLVCDPAAKRAPDRATIEKLVAGFETLLESRKVEPSPFVVLRMHDVITQYRIARNIERSVFTEGVVCDKALKNQNGATNGSVENGSNRVAKDSSRGAELHAGIEPLAKAWDRMRKALQALESVCGAEENGHVPSLADLATPILERADGVLEEAVAAENERRAEMQALEERNRELTARIPSTR
jgi:hypothetical protein